MQHWLFRFIIAYAMSLALLDVPARGRVRRRARRGRSCAGASALGLVHALLLVPFVYLSATLYAGSSAACSRSSRVAWHACAVAAALALLRHARARRGLDGMLRGRPAVAALRGRAGCSRGRGDQASARCCGSPAAEITFRIVVIALHPLLPALMSDPATLAWAPAASPCRSRRCARGSKAWA